MKHLKCLILAVFIALPICVCRVSAAETTNPHTMDVNEALTNVWRIVENDCVDEVPILRGLMLDDIMDWMEQTEFKEMRLYQRTNWNTVRLGTIGDMAVAQFSLDDEDLVWNVRMEKSTKRENRTSIEIPADAYTEILQFDFADVEYFQWENGDGTWTKIYFTHFPETNNLYTIYTNELIEQINGDELITNSRRRPYVVLHAIEGENLAMYNSVNEKELLAAEGKNDIRYFRIQTPEGCKTYQYVFGSRLGDWANSQYNTDGWHVVYKDGIPFYVVSADNRYMFLSYTLIWRTLKAEAYNPGK